MFPDSPALWAPFLIAIIIMSNERQPMGNPVIKPALSLKKKFISLFKPSRPPSPSPIDMDSSADNNMAVTAAGTR